MPVDNVSDFVIRGKNHSRYVESKIIEDDAIEVVLQKLEMLLFTSAGDVMGSAGYRMGGDLEYMLWETQLPNNIIESRLTDQINKYIPELPLVGYTMVMKIYEGSVDDIMKLEFTIKGYNINFVLEK